MCSKMRICRFMKDFYHRQTNLTKDYPDRLDDFCHALETADRVVVGAGAGFSAAAGLEYGGDRFARNFGDFISRYAIPDMYAATFYPFDTEEERWAYLARHIRLNRYDNEPACPLYRRLFQLIGDKDYFVITTNVDGLFKKSGFAPDRIFEVQGDYAYLQCAVGCHDRLYYNEELIRGMSLHTEHCCIPSSLVPHCPVCGGRMEMHVRKDRHFVESGQWQDGLDNYRSFMENVYDGHTLLIELGVGFNTPAIIRFPFEQMAARAGNITLVRINRDYVENQIAVSSFIPFAEDVARVLTDAIQKRRPGAGPVAG